MRSTLASATWLRRDVEVIAEVELVFQSVVSLSEPSQSMVREYSTIDRLALTGPGTPP